jgi:hypothetical protein
VARLCDEFFFLMARKSPVDLILVIVEVSRSHSGTPQSVELLWTSDWPVAETSTWPHITLTTDRHPCLWWDSNPRSQQGIGRRWVHTCNVTACCNAVTLQATDTIRRYELNFHPVPHGVTVSCERYTTGFPVCYGSPSDVFAEEQTVVTCHVARPHLLRP